MITNILRILLTRSFKPLVFKEKEDYKLSLDVNSTGIYVHIPFCTSLCSFCPYNKVQYQKELIEPYKEALIKEINLVGKQDGITRTISSIYFGGGTPALMLEELEEIIAALKNNFNIHSNIGIELHPRDITKEMLIKLKNIGFDMVSIGIQSFNENCLEKLEREYVDGAKKVKLAREIGFKTIDVDLIFGIVNQSPESLKKDFKIAFESGATQVSTYPFIDFSYANNKSKPLGKKEKKYLLESLQRVSIEMDCDRTAVWTFGKRNNDRYSSITRDTFIGFGPSATSLTRELFKINTFSVEEYIKCINKNSIPTALTMKFNKRTRALYWLFWNAYTLKLNNSQFKELFGVNLEDMFGVELRLGRLLGLLKKVEGGYILTKNGTYLYHLAEQKYTNQYIDKTWRAAKENPWPEEVELY